MPSLNPDATATLPSHSSATASLDRRGGGRLANARGTGGPARPGACV